MKRRSDKCAPDCAHNAEMRREKKGAENDTQIVEHWRQSVVEETPLNDEKRPQSIGSTEEKGGKSKIAEKIGHQELIRGLESRSHKGAYFSGKDDDHDGRNSHCSHRSRDHGAEIFRRSLSIGFQKFGNNWNKSGGDTAGDKNIKEKIGQ